MKKTTKESTGASVAPLLKWLDENGVKPADFARKIQVSDQVLGNWKRRGTVPMDNLPMVAAAMEMSMEEYLAESRGRRPAKNVAFRRRQAHVVSEPGPTVETINIRRFDNPASLGAGIERHEADMLVGHMTVNANWVRQNLPSISSPSNLEIMVGFGDSMVPTISDGDLMLVDRGVREVRTDAVYVFTLANELFVKTLQRIPGDGVRVISDNKKYETYVLDSSSKQEMEILARVVWAWNGRKL